MGFWWALFILLFLCGLLFLWLGRRGRARSGLPAGRVVFSDTSEWKRLQQPLFGRTYQLTGKPDYLVAEGSRLVPVEVKSGRAPEQPYSSHVLQLAAYCLLVEDCYDRRPSRGIIQYADRAFEVDYTPELRDELLSTLDEMRADLASGDAERNHEEPRRCHGCGYLDQCDQGLV